MAELRLAHLFQFGLRLLAARHPSGQGWLLNGQHCPTICACLPFGQSPSRASIRSSPAAGRRGSGLLPEQCSKAERQLNSQGGRGATAADRVNKRNSSKQVPTYAALASSGKVGDVARAEASGRFPFALRLSLEWRGARVKCEMTVRATGNVVGRAIEWHGWVMSRHPPAHSFCN